MIDRVGVLGPVKKIYKLKSNYKLTDLATERNANQVRKRNMSIPLQMSDINDAMKIDPKLSTQLEEEVKKEALDWFEESDYEMQEREEMFEHMESRYIDSMANSYGDRI